MGLKLLIVAAAVAGALTRSVAFACEPIGEPKPWYATGFAQFVATASSPRTGTAEIRAHLVVGWDGTEAMLPRQ